MVVKGKAMTEKQESTFDDLVSAVNELSIKLFGNGTRNGCIDQRLEHVETLLDSMGTTIVTKAECSKRHDVQWSRRVLYIGLVATWLGLVLRVMGVI